MAYLQFFEYFIATLQLDYVFSRNLASARKYTKFYVGMMVCVQRFEPHMSWFFGPSSMSYKKSMAPNFRIHKTFSSHPTLLAMTVVQNTRH